MIKSCRDWFKNSARYIISYSFSVCCFAIFFFIFSPASGQSQESEAANSLKTETESASKINFDGRVLAGLNGNSLFALSMTQGLSNFAYQLNSNVLYSNDFNNYNNSSFMTNETGFTGEISVLDSLKMIPEFEVANSSYGMFDNNYYSRESKDKIKVRLKTEYKPVPTRWDLDISYARYDHSLKENNSSLEDKDSFQTARAVIGMEYIWSASNKVGLKLENSINRYPSDYRSDAYSSNEFYGSFKVTEYSMVTLTPMLIWNKDGTRYVYFKGDLTSINLKHVSLDILHEYKLQPYRPEEVIYSQKFVSKVYDLPPATVNHTEAKCEISTYSLEDSDNVAFAIKSFMLRIKGFYERSNNFYNYYPIGSKDILSAEAIPVNFYNAKVEFVTTFILFKQKINLEVAYDHYRYISQGESSDENITYRPVNTVKCGLIYSGSRLEINWGNTFRGKTYADPSDDRKIGRSVLGTLDINIRLYNSVFLQSKVYNLYNEKYSYREGYPEPGIQFMAGLRINI